MSMPDAYSLPISWNEPPVPVNFFFIFVIYVFVYHFSRSLDATGDRHLSIMTKYENKTY